MRCCKAGIARIADWRIADWSWLLCELATSDLLEARFRGQIRNLRAEQAQNAPPGRFGDQC
eukprot:2948610-Alexandrium_andersonii.AAC.1